MTRDERSKADDNQSAETEDTHAEQVARTEQTADRLVGWAAGGIGRLTRVLSFSWARKTRPR